MNKETILYEDYTDEELIRYIIDNKLKKGDRILIEQFMKCGCIKRVLAIRLKSSKYIVDKEINRIMFLIYIQFKKIKNI